MHAFEEALQRFGLSEFRAGQREVISNLIAGHDCLCVMPTGGGKSLCYQLPTLLRPGLTIVVSPLIALMKDQVDVLVRRGIAATVINSSMTQSDQQLRLSQVAAGKYQLLYVAPERLRNGQFLDAMRATPIQLLAVDEAHCISEWGHDFRPDYSRIGKFREALGGVQTIALTATATPRVREDICQILRLRHPKQFVTGFARKNLNLGVVISYSDRDKDKAIVDFLNKGPGCGIIYAATRKRCEAIVELVKQEIDLPIAAYHAGLTPEQRKSTQEQFMSGELKAIVATNAFGMGIDKSDLRYVIHYNIPGSLEAYYQEAGRAGRDGLPSQCILFYSSQDRSIQEFFIENANPPAELIEEVYEFLCECVDDPIEMTAQEIRDAIDVPQSGEAVGAALQILAKTQVLERLEVSGGLAMVRLSSNMPTLVDMLPRDAEMRRKVLRAVERAVGDRRGEAVYVHPRWLMQETGLDRDTLGRHLAELRKLKHFEYVPPFRGRAIHFRRRNVPFSELNIDFKALDERKQSDLEKLEKVVAFAQSRRCRQMTILQYFGDPTAAPCGLCDRCHGESGWPKLGVGMEGSTDASDNDASTLNAAGANASVGQFESIHKQHKATTTATRLTVAHLDKLTAMIEAIDRLHGRLGKLIIIDFFCGSESERIRQLRLNRLPAYGLLKGVKKKHVTGIVEAMLTTDVLEQKEVFEKRPTVFVTDFGRKVANRTVPIPEFVETQLSEILLEGHIGTGQSKTNDREPDAGSLPLNGESGRFRIDAGHRVGPGFSEDGVLEDVGQSAKLAAATTANDSKQGLDAASLDGRDWEWTLRLARDGYSLLEIAAIRRKGMDAVLADLTSAAEAKQHFPTDKLLDSRTNLALQEASKNREKEPTSAVFREKPALWRLAVAMREARPFAKN